ncbi:hypothetical protein BH09DEP1_BH09DEP1_0310 [soil metagenome]
MSISKFFVLGMLPISLYGMYGSVEWREKPLHELFIESFELLRINPGDYSKQVLLILKYVNKHSDLMKLVDALSHTDRARMAVAMNLPSPRSALFYPHTFLPEGLGQMTPKKIDEYFQRVLQVMQQLAIRKGFREMERPRL